MVDLTLGIIAGISAIVAALSWREAVLARRAAQESADAARRSAQAAEQTAAADEAMLTLERRREHDRSRPTIEGRWKGGAGEGLGWVLLTSRADQLFHVEAVRVHLDPAGGITGFRVADMSVPALTQVDDLHPSVPLELLVEPRLADDGMKSGGPVVLSLDVTNGADRWTVPVELDVPGTPRIHVL